jgi:hypothetical protein
MIAELLAYFLIVLSCSLVISIAAGFYFRIFYICRTFAKWIGRRMGFYYDWFSFLYRRRKFLPRVRPAPSIGARSSALILQNLSGYGAPAVG